MGGYRRLRGCRRLWGVTDGCGGADGCGGYRRSLGCRRLWGLQTVVGVTDGCWGYRRLWGLQTVAGVQTVVGVTDGCGGYRRLWGLQTIVGDTDGCGGYRRLLGLQTVVGLHRVHRATALLPSQGPQTGHRWGYFDVLGLSGVVYVVRPQTARDCIIRGPWSPTPKRLLSPKVRKPGGKRGRPEFSSKGGGAWGGGGGLKPEIPKVRVPQTAKSVFPFVHFIISHNEIRVRGGGVVWHKASVSDCSPLTAPIGLSPLLILTLCGPQRVLVVSTEPPDDLSCLTTPGVGRPGDGAVARAVDPGIQTHTPSPCGGLPTPGPGGGGGG